MDSRRVKRLSSHGDGRSSVQSAEDLNAEDSSERRTSRRLTSDVHFDLIMPRLKAMREQISSQGDSIGQLESENKHLSHVVKESTIEITKLRDQLQIAETATLSALKDVCKDRNDAQKEASDLQSRLVVAQVELKRELEKYHRRQEEWESEKVQWSYEKKRLQNLQRDAGVKLMSLLEELLEVQSTFDQQSTGAIPPISQKLTEPDENVIKPELGTERKDTTSAQEETRRIGRSESKEAPRGSRREEANSSRKRSSGYTSSEPGSNFAPSIPEMPQVPLAGHALESNKVEKDAAPTANGGRVRTTTAGSGKSAITSSEKRGGKGDKRKDDLQPSTSAVEVIESRNVNAEQASMGRQNYVPKTVLPEKSESSKSSHTPKRHSKQANDAMSKTKDQSSTPKFTATSKGQESHPLQAPAAESKNSVVEMKPGLSTSGPKIPPRQSSKGVAVTPHQSTANIVSNKEMSAEKLSLTLNGGTASIAPKWSDPTLSQGESKTTKKRSFFKDKTKVFSSCAGSSK